MSEAADAADLAAVRVARKQTNTGRAAEELAKSAATLMVPSKILPIRLLNKKCGVLLANRPTNGRAAEELAKTAAAAATCCRWCF